MTEYTLGPNGEPTGPESGSLSEIEKARIQACMAFFDMHSDRMREFARRAEAAGLTGADAVVTLINVDDPTGNGALLADLLMPGTNWQQYRDMGDIPVARGLADKHLIAEALDALGYSAAAGALMESDDLQFMVLHAETVQVMDIRFE